MAIQSAQVLDSQVIDAKVSVSCAMFTYDTVAMRTRMRLPQDPISIRTYDKSEWGSNANEKFSFRYYQFSFHRIKRWRISLENLYVLLKLDHGTGKLFLASVHFFH